MPLWIVGLVGVVIVVLFLRAINVSILSSSRGLEEKVEDLRASTLAVAQAMSEQALEISDQLQALKKSLMPVVRLAESRIDGIEPKQLAEVSHRVDRLIEAIEKIKTDIQRKEEDAARQIEEWKIADAKRQAEVQAAKRLTRTQRSSGSKEPGPDSLE